MKTKFTALVFALCLLTSFVPAIADSHLPKSATFDSNGVEIHYTVQGEGEPLILIHGFTATKELQWGSMIAELAKDYRVVAFDNRGHGKSGKPHGKENYGDEMVLDVIRLMDHLGIEKAHVAGYSLGGFLTMKLIAEYPERLLSAAPSGAGWQSPETQVPGRDLLAESLESGNGFGPLFRALTPAGNPPPSDEQIAAINAALSAQNDVVALAAVIRGMDEWMVTEDQLRKNEVPTLSLIGEIDPLKDGVDAMTGKMKNHEVVVIEGADHMNAFMNPKFVKALKAHLTANSALVAAGN